MVYYLIHIKVDDGRASFGPRPKELALPCLDIGGKDMEKLCNGVVEVLLECESRPANAVIETLWEVILESGFEHLESQGLDGVEKKTRVKSTPTFYQKVAKERE